MMRGALLFILLACTATTRAAEPRITVKTNVAGKWIEGLPLRWSDNEVNLLARDGYLHTFKPDKATQSSKIADDFRSFTAAELRGRLLRQFGSRFDVSGTGHYLVVHPAGERDLWAERFEELYRSFIHYFRVRGLEVRELEFPLVSIVFHSPHELYAYAAREGSRIAPGVLGYYSPTTNRVALFDQGRGKATERDWAENNFTIIHEAAHQTAFNTGLHSRYATPPRWVVEGLGTMFEAPGVWNSHQFRRRSDRINAGRLADFKKLALSRLNGPALKSFIASDQAYQREVNFAYATGWALTFYLVETRPAKYCQYLSRTANRPAFESYPAEERLKDFTETFGGDFAMQSAHLLRFIGDLE